MTRIGLIVFLTSVILTPGGFVNAKEDYKTPRFYILNLTQTTWPQAQTICEENGGKLATIYDLSTVPDLDYSHVMQSTDGLFWVGLHTSESGWFWDNGDPFTWSNWNQSQPGPGCVAASVIHPYLWFSGNCGQRRPYLCQYSYGECRFVEFQDRSIAAHNYLYVYQKSANECKQMCRESDTFVCQSFEYNPSGGRCQFNSGNMWTLVQFYAEHEGWTYYHRTCNSGNVTGRLLDLTQSVTISPSPTAPAETPIECSEQFQTKDVFVTHNVFHSQLVPISTIIPVTTSIYVTRDITMTQNVFVTRDLPVTRGLFVTKHIPVYQDINVTHDVMITNTVNSTVTITEVITLTSTYVISPSPVFLIPSSTVLEDPIDEELKEISEAVKERHKNLKKISMQDDRPSATYVGYVAVAFLSAVFGSIVLFDILTIFRDKPFCNNKKKNKSIDNIEDTADGSSDSLNYRFESGQKSIDARTGSRDKNVENAESSASNTGTSKENSNIGRVENADNYGGTGSRRAVGRLWQFKSWSIGDSGFDGSENTSDAAGSENSTSGLSHSSCKETRYETVHVSIERQESDIDLEETFAALDYEINGAATDINVISGQEVMYSSDLSVKEHVESIDTVTHF